MRTIEPLFTGKVTALSRIALIEKKEVWKTDKEKLIMTEEVISNDSEVSETFKKGFAIIVPHLKIIPGENFTIQYETENPVQNAIIKLKSHTSIKMTISKIQIKYFRFAQFCLIKF